MRSCSALINPSTFEGWSTTVEEAKGLGTPMILSSLRVHKEQNSHAIFFDADSPEQLAEILIDFVPLSRTRRAAIEEAAHRQAADNMRLFARQFSELMQFSALQK
jgi:glycosyltransferase involved in cell wall biosynthesis